MKIYANRFNVTGSWFVSNDSAEIKYRRFIRLHLLGFKSLELSQFFPMLFLFTDFFFPPVHRYTRDRSIILIDSTSPRDQRSLIMFGSITRPTYPKEAKKFFVFRRKRWGQRYFLIDEALDETSTHARLIVRIIKFPRWSSYSYKGIGSAPTLNSFSTLVWLGLCDCKAVLESNNVLSRRTRVKLVKDYYVTNKR